MNNRDVFLSLLFNPGETVCASHNSFAYHSVSLNDIHNNKILLISPNPKAKNETITSQDIALIAINPINGHRCDKNVTNYRSFLIELDNSSLFEQQQYIKSMRVPFSICIFSGNKSLHYLITLEKDLTNEQDWRYVAQWILNILVEADPLTKNPSRSIRFPDHKRKDGKQLFQQLLFIGKRIPNKDLMEWLSKFPEKKPQIRNIPDIDNENYLPNFKNIPKYVQKWVESGIHTQDERNNKWFKTALAFAKANYPEEITINVLNQFFVEQSSFRYQEWLNTIKSAYKQFEQGEV